MKNNITKNKTMEFAVRIVKLSNYLKDTQKEFVLSEQLFKYGTAIAANVHEAQNTASKKDFINKMYCALQEANSTEYWLELLFQTKYLSNKEFDSIHVNCKELIGLLTAIVKTAKKNEENQYK